MYSLELMQQRKSQYGSNLNTITNKQWEMLNEYVPSSNLELSEESHILNTDDEDKRSSSCSEQPPKKSLRKALILDNETDDNTDTDFDKENTSLYPSLSDLKSRKSKVWCNLKKKRYSCIKWF